MYERVVYLLLQYKCGIIILFLTLENNLITSVHSCRLFPLREQGLNFYAHELTQDEIKVKAKVYNVLIFFGNDIKITFYIQCITVHLEIVFCSIE